MLAEIKQNIVEMYQAQKKSLPQIGKILGIDPKTVSRNLEKMGVARRTISEAVLGEKNHNFRKMGSANPRWGQHHTSASKHKMRLAQLENKSCRWMGENVSIEGGRCRCRRKYSALICERCGQEATKQKPLGRHHRDQNPKNNLPGNIEILCRPCHVHIHVELRRKERKIKCLNAEAAGLT